MRACLGGGWLRDIQVIYTPMDQYSRQTLNYYVIDYNERAYFGAFGRV